jgi:hypothetical protein
MTEWREELERWKEEARHFREEAERLQADMGRLRGAGRDAERQLRREERARAREERQQERRERRSGPGQAWDDLPPGEGVPTTADFSLEGVSRVTVDQTAGRLLLRLCREGETPGLVSLGRKSAPRVDVERTGDRLAIAVRLTPGWLFRRRQGVTTTIRLLPGLGAVEVDAGYGNLHVQEISAESIRLEVGAGDIQCFGTAGTLRANVGAGKCALYEHSGLARCDIGTGDLLLDIARAVPGEYRANAGIGRVEVRLPPGESVRTEVSSGLGRTRSEYPGGPDDAPIRLEANTGVGEAVVRARQASEAPAGAAPTGGKGMRPQRGALARRREAEELRVLQLLEQGRITSQEAAELIAALQGTTTEYE